MTELTMTSQPARRYLPAAGRDFLLPLYDTMAKLMGADRARNLLLDRAEIHRNQRVLDIGCGTGTLVVAIKQRHPDTQVVGLDPDGRVLARATRKAEKVRANVQLDQGFADTLPYADGSFDHVFSTFTFHHLEGDQKLPTLREIRRVLKPSGRLHLVDFGGHKTRNGGFLRHLLHSHGRLRDNSEAHVLELMRSAGLNAKVIARGSAVFGLAKLVHYAAWPR